MYKKKSMNASINKEHNWNDVRNLYMNSNLKKKKQLSPISDFSVCKL